MKKGLAALLAVLMILGTGLVPVSVLAEDSADDGYGTQWVYYGDLDGNSGINASDALMALKVSVGKITPDEIQTVVGDVNKDTHINASDALMILQYSVGRIAVFPAGDTYVITTSDDPSDVDPEVPEPIDIAAYDKSNSVNNAYVADETADTSYIVDVSSLQPNTIYRFASAVVTASADHARLVYSLQGLINRDFGIDEDHTVLLYGSIASSDGSWFNIVTAEGELFSTMDVVPIRNWDAFYEIFKDVIISCGMVLWDGNVPSTSNVAATICGLDGYLPVLAESDLRYQLEEDGVPVKQSLTNLFIDGKAGRNISGTTVKSTGSAKNDAYLWALEKYFPRCSSDYLAYILDGAMTLKGYGAYPNHPTALLPDTETCLSNMDYIIARRAFCFDLAVYKGEAACDDPAQQNGDAPYGTDNQTMLKIFAARYARANGNFGQLLGFPPWWVKYTTHNGQGSVVGTTIEWLFTEYITCYNLAKEADAAHPAAMTNGSVYYKYIPHTTQYENNRTTEDIHFDINTFYYTIYVGDYDSSAWLKEHMYTMWVKNGGDRYRGKVNMMWSINPNLSYRVPMIFDYLYEHKTDMDYFAGGDGGAGYIIPEALFGGTKLAYMQEMRPAQNADAGQVWADYTKPFYQRFDMDITGFMINGANYTMSKKIAESFNQFSPVGTFYNCYNSWLVKYQGVPYVYCQNGIDESTDMSVLYNHAIKSKDQKNANFSAYRTICRTPRQINTIVTNFEAYAADKGLTVKYCDPYTLFKLLKESGQGTELQ